MRSTLVRAPDFLIIGAMKSATSSLYHWLADQPDCFLAEPKETNFFSDERNWARGVSWYSDRFSDAAPDMLLGEASVSYTDRDRGEVASERMASLIPHARLIYIVRDPIERLRSHYRHEVQRSRERRPLLDALSEPGNPYTAASRYFERLRPYVERFPRSHICVVRFEDLVTGEHPGWFDVIRFLDLPQRPCPGTVYNVTSNNSGWSPLLRWLMQMGIVRFRTIARLPRPVRRLGHRLLMRDGMAYEAKLTQSEDPIPDEITAPIWEDIQRLQHWLEAPAPLWQGVDDVRVAGEPR